MCCRLFGVVERLVEPRDRCLDVIALVRRFQELVARVRQGVRTMFRESALTLGLVPLRSWAVTFLPRTTAWWLRDSSEAEGIGGSDKRL